MQRVKRCLTTVAKVADQLLRKSTTTKKTLCEIENSERYRPTGALSHILASPLKSYERKFSHENFPQTGMNRNPKTHKWIPGSAITPPKRGKGGNLAKLGYGEGARKTTASTERGRPDEVGRISVRGRTRVFLR